MDALGQFALIFGCLQQVDIVYHGDAFASMNASREYTLKLAPNKIIKERLFGNQRGVRGWDNRKQFTVLIPDLFSFTANYYSIQFL
jgi:hypothetical protein